MTRTPSTPIDVISGDIVAIAEQIARGDVASPMGDPAKKRAFAEVYAVTGSLPKASEAALVSTVTGRKWLRDPRFVAAVFAERQTRLSGEGSSLGYATLIEICSAMVEGEKKFLYPASERRQAALSLLRLGGHSEAMAAQHAMGSAVAALHELTEDQLRAHIASAGATLLALEAPSRPLPPAVAPDMADKPSLI